VRAGFRFRISAHNGGHPLQAFTPLAGSDMTEPGPTLCRNTGLCWAFHQARRRRSPKQHQHHHQHQEGWGLMEARRCPTCG
jgi:hypothetical protein